MPIIDYNKTSANDAVVVSVEDASTSDTLGITANNEAKVSVTQPLPTGSNNIGSIINVTGTVSLPTGASTSVLQTTGNTSLAGIDGKLNTLGQKPMTGSVPVSIASDQSNVSVNLTQIAGAAPSAVNPAPSRLTDGTSFYDSRQIRALTNSDVVKAQLQDNAGTAITLGENVNALSIPVVPSLDWTDRPTFTVVGAGVAPALNKSMLAIQNAGGSSVIVRIREIKIYSVQTGAVTGAMNDFRLHRIASFTGGTSITVDQHDTNDSINGSVTCATGSTVSGEGARYLRRTLWSADEFGAGTADAETTEHTMAQTLPFYTPIQYTRPLVLRAGQGLHVKQTVSTTAGTFDIVIVFTQEST